VETCHGFTPISGKMATSCVRRQYCLIKGGHIPHPHLLFAWTIDSSILHFSSFCSWHQLTLFTLALLLAIPPDLQAQLARQYSCASRLCVGVTVQTFGILLTLAGFLILACGDNVNIGRSPVQSIVPWQASSFALHNTHSGCVQLLSLGTGMKCLPKSCLSVHSDVLHDSHVEVIVWRSAIWWLLEKVQCDAQAQGQSA
jgi:Adenosine-deaminase (editase) domain